MDGDTNLLPACPAAADLNAEIQRFVQQLAADVSGAPIALPSYPVVALRVQRILMDPNAGTERVITIIGSEPVLAGKIIMMANSSALCNAGGPVTDLRTAVKRLGFDALRTAAISFAIAQLRGAPAYRGIVEPMKQLYQSSIEAAAMCHVLARQCDRASPDAAMLAGLVSGMGKLYILTRTDQYPLLFADSWVREEMLHEWHAQVARSILEHWQFAAEVVDAVAEMERATLDARTRPNLADVLACSYTILQNRDSPAKLASALQASRAAQRLGLKPELCKTLLAQSSTELIQLRRALGG